MAVSSPVVSGMARAGSAFLAFLVRRTVVSLVSLALFVTGVFFLVDLLIPYENPAIDPEISGGRRYLDYMGGLVRLDLGLSYGGASVAGLIAKALPTTLLIFATGGILAYLLGSWLGRVVEWRRGRIEGGLATALGLIFYTMFPPLLVFLLVHFGRDPLL